MRKLKFTTYKTEYVDEVSTSGMKYSKRVSKPIEHTGTFQGWGYDTEEGDTTVVSFTAAICEEDETKLVFLIHPNNIVFLE